MNAPGRARPRAPARRWNGHHLDDGELFGGETLHIVLSEGAAHVALLLGLNHALAQSDCPEVLIHLTSPHLPQGLGCVWIGAPRCCWE